MKKLKYELYIGIKNSEDSEKIYTVVSLVMVLFFSSMNNSPASPIIMSVYHPEGASIPK